MIHTTIVSSLFYRELHVYMFVVYVCVYVCMCVCVVCILMCKVKIRHSKISLSVTLSPSSTRRKHYILYIAFTLRKIESTRVAIRSQRITLNTCQQSAQAPPVTTSRLLTRDTLSGQQHTYTHTHARTHCREGELKSKDTKGFSFSFFQRVI